MTNDWVLLRNSKPHYKTNKVIVIDDQVLPISEVESFSIHTMNVCLWLYDVFHVFDVSRNLMFVKQLCKESSCSVCFNDTSFVKKDKMTGQFSFGLDFLPPRYIWLVMSLCHSIRSHWLPLSRLWIVDIIISTIHILVCSQVIVSK